MRVVLVEDNPANIALMGYLLRAAGHDVTEVVDGESAFAAIRNSSPDIVLCDIDLPGISGYDVAAVLKRDVATRSLPLIAVTAFAMVDDREKALKHGFDGYLAKPIEPRTFVSQIQDFSRPARRARSKAASLPAAKVLLVDNVPANLAVLRGILEPFGYITVEAQSADEGLAKVYEDPPDFVVSDIHMLPRDGFDLVRSFRAHAHLRDVPVLLVSSGLEVDSYTRQASAVGAGFLSRPFPPGQFLSAVRACLKSKTN